MAPSRKLTNGRSPLVNKQHQITSFFSKSPSPSLKPTPQSQFSKPPNPNPNPNKSPTSSPPTTPSPINGKSKPKSTTKPKLVIGAQKPSSSPSPSPPNSVKKSFSEEVVNRKIRVYWPLDDAWYEGCVKSFDKVSGKHLVEYDDDEEELIDLSKEKIEWIEVEGGSSVRHVKKRRLRKVAIVVDDDEEEEGEGNVGTVEDDSSDEDWGKNGLEVEEKDCLEEMDMELEDEEEVGKLKRKRGDNGGGKGKKMKKSEEGSGEVAVSSKTKKAGFVFGDFGTKPCKPVINVQGN